LKINFESEFCKNKGDSHSQNRRIDQPGENDIQAAKNKQSAFEIVLQPAECPAKLSVWFIRLVYPLGLSS